jgi:hypothetical protein
VLYYAVTNHITFKLHADTHVVRNCSGWILVTFGSKPKLKESLAKTRYSMYRPLKDWLNTAEIDRTDGPLTAGVTKVKRSELLYE